MTTDDMGHAHPENTDGSGVSSEDSSIFERIAEYLSCANGMGIRSDRITYDTELYSDLNLYGMDFFDLIMWMEAEFNIEGDVGQIGKYVPGEDWFLGLWRRMPETIFGIKIKKKIYKSATVRSLIEAVHQKRWPASSELSSFAKSGGHEVTALNQDISNDVVKINDAPKRVAFQNIMNAIDPSGELPGRVFETKMSNFYFFASDWVASCHFVELIQDMMRVEMAEVTCCMNVTRSKILEFEAIDAIYIDHSTKGEDYDEFWTQDIGDEVGWLFTMDRHAFASNVGEWCIYAERMNDVAVIAFNVIDIEKYKPHLDRLNAHNIFDLIYSDKGYDPYDKLVEEWKAGLCKYYIL